MRSRGYAGRRKTQLCMCVEDSNLYDGLCPRQLCMVAETTERRNYKSSNPGDMWFVRCARSGRLWSHEQTRTEQLEATNYKYQSRSRICYFCSLSEFPNPKDKKEYQMRSRPRRTAHRSTWKRDGACGGNEHSCQSSHARQYFSSQLYEANHGPLA